MRQVIGTFEVINQNGLTMHVTVSQENHIDIHGVVVDHRKVFTIDNETEEELVPTKDPSILLRQDGTRLKKIGPIKTGTLPNIMKSRAKYT